MQLKLYASSGVALDTEPTHRGMIRLALRDRSAGRADLTKALALDPHFSSLGAPKARAALA